MSTGNVREGAPAAATLPLGGPRNQPAAPSAAAPAATSGPKLPESSKELLRRMAEELLLLSGQAEAAEARADATQRALDALAAAQGIAGGGDAADGEMPLARLQAERVAVEHRLLDTQRRALAAETALGEAHKGMRGLQAQLARTQGELAVQNRETAELRQQMEQLQQSIQQQRERERERHQQAGSPPRTSQQQQQQQQEAVPAVSPTLSPSPQSKRQQSQQQARDRPEEVLSLRQKLLEERRQRQVDVERIRQLESQLAQLQAQQRAQQGQQAQQLGPLSLPQPQQGEQGQHQDEQQQVQQRRQEEAEGQGQQAATAAPAGVEGRQTAAGSRGSSADDDTISLSQPAAAAGRPQDGMESVSAPAAAAGRDAGSMRPPPQRLGRLKDTPAAPQAIASSPAVANGSGVASGARKRPGHAPVPPPNSKHQRQGGSARAAGGAALPAAVGAAAAAAGSMSPGESAMGAVAVLGRDLSKRAAVTPEWPRAAAAANGGSAAAGADAWESALLNGAGDLLLFLKEPAAAGAQHKQQDSGGGERRRLGRRSNLGATSTTSSGGRGSGGVGVDKGETAEQWLNRAVGNYVQTVLLSNPSFKSIFGQPVSRDVAGYHDVIHSPMDLGTIKAKAQRGEYSSPQLFQRDLMLVITNAQTYNESPSHPVHKAATDLIDMLNKPRSFFLKVEEQFQAARRAELAAVMAEHRAAQEAELEAVERQLAAKVQGGLTVAVYAEDDEQHNKYYLMQATGPVEVLHSDEQDDFGQEYKRGDTVVKGHYWDYWLDSRSQWDRTRRPYYLQCDKLAFVPASALLMVDLKLQQRPEPEISPFDATQHAVHEVSHDLHRQIRQQIKKMTAEPAVEL